MLHTLPDAHASDMAICVAGHRAGPLRPNTLKHASNKAVWVQKLKQFVSLLEPDRHPQMGASALEQVVYEECSEAVRAGTVFGQVLVGPAPSYAGIWVEQHELPASLPLWPKSELEKLPRFRLANNRRLTIDCLQV